MYADFESFVECKQVIFLSNKKHLIAQIRISTNHLLFAMTYHPVNYGFTGSGGLNFALVQTANDLKDVGKTSRDCIVSRKKIFVTTRLQKKHRKFFFRANKCSTGNLDRYLPYIMTDTRKPRKFVYYNYDAVVK